MLPSTALEKNIKEVKQRMAIASAKRGVDVNNITLVAVTKTVPVEAIKTACELGIKQFGENKAQEALHKIQSLPSSIYWHFIGHLQTNKVKFVVPSFELVQSLDRIKLAEALQKEGEKNNKVVQALLQVNISYEESKSGFHPEEINDALRFVAACTHLKVIGLMTIVPYEPQAEKVRPYFRKLYNIFKGINIPGVEMKYLSMGMTNDFDVAIEEGANMIRVGTAIFGERDY